MTSAGYQYGGRLSLRVFLFGSDAGVRLPGAAVISLTVLIYCFPLVFLLFNGKITKKEAFFIVIFMLMFFPILFIYGSFPVSASGGAPRYILPLIPIACILSGQMLVDLFKTHSLWLKTIICVVLFCWQFLLTYPAPILFKISPKFAFAAHYSPVYQAFSFENYPTHINALARWVKESTPKNSIIVVPALNPYHFYYYAKRDVIKSSNLKPDVLEQVIRGRPMYFVEDHLSLYNPLGINEIKSMIKSIGLDYTTVGEVKLFSPYAGRTTMHIYKISESQ